MVSHTIRVYVVLSAHAFTAILSAHAGEVWDGGGSNDNWTTGANWNVGPSIFQLPPPNNGTANVAMPAVAGLVQVPIVDVPYSINSMTFNDDSDDGRFVILCDEELTIGAGGVTNNDADIQSIVGPMKLAANQTWNAATGRLQSDTVNLNGFNLTLTGAHQIDQAGIISGSGGVTVSDSFTSIANLFGGVSNTYTGLTDVRGGTLVLQKSSGVAVPGDLLIRDGAAVVVNGDEQISQAIGNEVIVNAGGFLYVNVGTETLAELVIDQGAVNVKQTAKLIAAEAVVSGAAASWTNEGELIVNGMLEIIDGGRVHNILLGIIADGPGSIGIVTVDGIGSTWTSDYFLSVGNEGNGTLVVENGGRVDTLDSVDIGRFQTAMGEVTVDGLGSKWTVERTMFIGTSGGNGTLNIRNGGEVRVDNVGGGTGISVEIASTTTATGIVNVDGISSTWITVGQVRVGDTGNGEMHITAGGEVHNTGTSHIGSRGSSVSEVTVDGMASMWTNTDELHVGNRANGTLTVTNGGQVQNTGTGYIGYDTTATGNVTVHGMGSNWTNSGNLHVGNLGTGTLTVTNGATVSATHVVVGALGSLYGDGNIVGFVQNSGLVSPGTSAGTLTIDEDYTQTADGELRIELGSASSYDQLHVIDNATLAGTFTVNLIDGFVPSIGQSFTILTADHVDDTFTTVLFPSVANLEFNLIYNAQSVVLSVVPAGDFNHDGAVDAADYVVWRKNSGGIYTQNDFNTWRAHFGQSSGTGSAATGSESANATVPEPKTQAILIVAMLMFARQRARKS